MDKDVKTYIQNDIYHAICILHENLGEDSKEDIKRLVELVSEEFNLNQSEVLDVLNDLIKKEKSESKKGWILE